MRTLVLGHMTEIDLVILERSTARQPQPALSLNRCSLPVSVRGRLSTKATARGY